MADNRIHTATDIDGPRFHRAWTQAREGPLAMVYCGSAFFVFGDAQVARDLAAECLKAAEALERLASEAPGTELIQDAPGVIRRRKRGRSGG